MRQCNKCNTELVLGDNWFESMKKNSTYTCKPCWNIKTQKYKKAHPESAKLSDKKYRDKIGNLKSKQHWLSYREDQHHVYIIPKHNYIGVTRNPYYRKSAHKNTWNRDITGFKILHTYNNREDALAKESEYHSMGYNG